MNSQFRYDQYDEIVTVTPQVAAKWLEKNTLNRNVSRAHVLTIANDMKSGRWMDYSPIMFDIEGQLLDGQHRLLAIIQSNVSIKMMVRWNLPVEMRRVIDIGKSRMSKDLLALDGFQNTRTIASALFILLRWENGWSVGGSHIAKPITRTELTEAARSFPIVADAAAWFEGSHRLRKIYKGSSAGVAAMCLLAGHEKAEEFFTLLYKGIAPHENHPLTRLNNKLINNEMSGFVSSRDTNMAKVVSTGKAFAAFVANKDVKILRVVRGELCSSFSNTWKTMRGLGWKNHG